MKIKNFLKANLLLIVCAPMLFLSCSKDAIELDAENSSENIEASMEASSSSKASCSNSVTIPLLGQRTIRIYSEIEIQGTITQNDLWNTALTTAMADWNTASLNNCLVFERTTVNSQFNPADIVIENHVFGGGAYAYTPLVPTSGDPLPLIQIDIARSVFDSDAARSNTVAHEIGHAIFQEHQASTTSIMFQDPANLATTGLSGADRTRYSNCYGGCTSGGNGNLTILGPDTICTSSPAQSVTYTLSDSSLSPEWSVSSSNLQIIGCTNCPTVTVQPLGISGPTQVTITASFPPNNTPSVAPKVVTLSNGPVPNGPAVITGPSQLSTYQSGSFYTSNNNFNNYTSVQWVVFSYNFPNAGQHFNIQNSGNNDFFREIEVLSTAPAGDYTVQCIVNNSCGSYYIDKSFNVKKGNPQIFK